MEYKRYYFENSVLCGNCNGEGLQGYMDYCRACGGSGLDSREKFLREQKGDPILLSMKYSNSINELKRA